MGVNGIKSGGRHESENDGADRGDRETRKRRRVTGENPVLSGKQEDCDRMVQRKRNISVNELPEAVHDVGRDNVPQIRPECKKCFR